MISNKEKKLIKEALIEFNKREISAIRELPPYEYEISDKFNNDMNALLLRMQNLERKIHIKKRIFMVAAIIAISLMLVGCCVLGGFIIRDYDNGRGTNFYLSGEGGKETFEEIYMPTIPEEYILDGGYDFPTMKSYVWHLGDKEIIFEQELTENRSVLLDTEYKDYSVIEINGCTIYYIGRYDDYVALWLYDGYLFNVMTDGGVTFEEVCDIIESVKVIPEESPAVK